MNERNLKDLINCDSTDNEKMMEAAKEKLRWYTFEASEEEFDVEAVDVLVRFLRDVEPELGGISEDEKDKSVHVQMRRVIEWNRGKIAAAVVIGVLTLTLASIIVGNSLGNSLAWEDGGFFKWLQRDKKGQTIITSPNDLGIEDGNVKYYHDISKLPEEYRKYIEKLRKIEEIKGCEIEYIEVYEVTDTIRIGVILVLEKEKRLEVGIMIFEKEVSVIRENYDNLEYKYTKCKGNNVYDVFTKINMEGNEERLISFYENNIKYFLTGELDIDFLEKIALKYMEL